MAPAEVPEQHRAFAERVARTRIQDPMPTFEALAATTRIPVDDLVHHALVRWAASGSEALMAIEPQALRELVEARRREDWDAVAGNRRLARGRRLKRFPRKRPHKSEWDHASAQSLVFSTDELLRQSFQPDQHDSFAGRAR